MALVSFVVAVFRNVGSVALTHAAIRGLFADELKAHDYEIVFVDDGSDDGSLDELVRLHQADPKVHVVSFTRNFGQMSAIVAGFHEARGDAVINISADLQDPISLAAQMVAEWERGHEVVACYRAGRDDPFGARLTSSLAYGLLRLSVPQLPPGGFDYVLLDRKAVDFFNSIRSRARFFQAEVLWPGYRTAFLPYHRARREHGRSQYTIWKKMRNFLDAAIDASYAPIRGLAGAGFLLALVGFFWGATIVVSWLLGTTPFQGWAPIMVGLLTIGGMNMVLLGIVGEYVWRIFDELRSRPHYVVRQRY
jgi:dolichol-phosphate mannosyltransferase